MADSLQNVEALVFDVFGTVVDWRGSVSSALREANPHLNEGKTAETQHSITGPFNSGSPS